MAKVAKYLLIEEQKQKSVRDYEKSLHRYVSQRKISNASNEELVNMIFDKKLRTTSDFLNSDNPRFWSELMSRVSNVKSIELLNNLKKILLHVARVSDSFFDEIENLKTLFAVAQLETDYIRPIETWKPKTRNRFKQCHSLIRHLFAKYEVPEFLDKGFSTSNLETITLFISIGQGKSFKEYEFKPNIVLNKKTYHHLFTTPENYEFFEAFRRAQVLSLGGNERLVDCVLGSFLRRGQNTVKGHKKEEFWVTVIQFFINQGMFDYSHVRQILDYIDAMKYKSVVENQRIIPPPMPDFEIKGRTIAALIRNTEDWHEHLAKTAPKYKFKKVNYNSWKPYDLKDFRVTLTNSHVYEIVQYTTAHELALEGSEMNHCVSTYARSCAEGSISIWSLRQVLNKGISHKKYLTIELDNVSKKIVQIRGKSNRSANAYEMSIINLWSSKENITFGRYI